METLRKAGITDLDSKKSKTPDSNEMVSETEKDAEVALQDHSEVSKPSGTELKPVAGTNEQALSSTSQKKSVSFAADHDEGPTATTKPNGESKPDKAGPKSSLVQGSFDSNARVYELDDDDEIIGSMPVIPEDESPEDARLRREMLQYNLNEVGSVVAELELDENYSDDDDEYIDELALDDDLPSLNSDLSEDEDEHGRSTGPVISDDYRRQMLELEEKLQTQG